MKSLVAFVLVTAVASTGRADVGGRNALQLVLDASARAQHGDHSGAAKLYLEAYQLASDPALLPVAALELRRDGRPHEALGAYCTYLSRDPKGREADAALRAVRELAGNAETACMPNAKSAVDLPPRGWTPPLTPATEAVPLREMTPVTPRAKHGRLLASQS
jgi:hypothetical protein